jgi:bifunctional non-homologous end joining protein LigD
MSLREYKQKRSLKDTPEPRAQKKSSKEKLSFVVQQHAASHLHYDFRLEIDGVLKSWAVPKGPSMSPKEKRLAIMVEDHPYDYKDFEGIIPEGNYVAGTVIVWDKGNFYLEEGLTKKETANLYQKQFKKGHVTFFLQGEKLKGTFSLIRIKNRGENEWLLIKKQDGFSMEDGVLKQNKSVKSGKTLQNMAKEKKIPEKKIRRMKKYLKEDEPDISPMPHNLKPMLATAVDSAFDSPEWIFETKWDGYRAMAEINKGKAKLVSRNLKSFNSKFPSIAEKLEQWNINTVLDGEIVALDKSGRPDFQLLQNFMGKAPTLVYYVFDMLWLDGYDMRDLPLSDRKLILKEALKNFEDESICYSPHEEKSGIDCYNKAIENGLEGIIAKKADSIYRNNFRSRNWLKIKVHKRLEAIICGYTGPRNSRKHFGSLILGVYDENGQLKYIGQSGGGFNEKALKSIKEQLEKISVSKSPFEKPPKTNTKATWVKPELVCEVKFTEWTLEGQMRHPVFEGMREDKPAKEVFIEKEKPVKPVVKKISRTKKTHSSNANKEVTIDKVKLKLTNLTKVYWPDEGYTKGNLIEYYSKIAPYMLPYLKNRPQSLNRHPNGIMGKNFFQKDMRNLPPDWMETVKIFSESQDKTINYMVCANKADLIYMANLGCIEINPWNSRIGSLDYPDYSIIDLDPLDVPFDYVIKTAQVVKVILDEAGLKAYCKTSGSKGLHILIPLGETNYTNEDSKELAHTIAKIVHERIPDITSIVRSPSKRKGKVYIDYLQNRKGQTLAAPYSVRPKPGATVSTPLSWEEIKPGLDTKQFNINTIFNRIEQSGDLLKGMFRVKPNMEKALKKLSAML